jgi:hypothetical protein
MFGARRVRRDERQVDVGLHARTTRTCLLRGFFRVAVPWVFAQVDALILRNSLASQSMTLIEVIAAQGVAIGAHDLEAIVADGGGTSNVLPPKSYGGLLILLAIQSG